MAAYVRCVYQWEITLENSGVKICEDFGQDLGWESVHWANRIDGRPQFTIHTGELARRVGVNGSE